ncbi:MAG: hypothetical protein ABFS32_19090 [Bacteroidota bacterium]
MIRIHPISENDYHELSVMFGELLSEIMDALNERVFNYDLASTERRSKELIHK